MRARARVRQSEASFQTLVDSVKDYAIFLLSREGIVQTWNAGAQRLKGYTPDEIIGRSFELFYTPEDRAAGRPHRLLAIARAEGRVEDEGFRVRKDGTHFWADVVITALYDHDGQFIGYGKVTRDLTERREAEQERARRMAAERAAERFERLQSATAALAAASRPDQIANVLAQTTYEALNASVVAVSLTHKGDDRLEQTATRGGAEPPRLRSTIARSSDTRKAVFEQDTAVPLIFERRVIGVLGVHCEPARELDVDERGFLLALAEVGAQAVDRARLFESEKRARADAEQAVRAQDEFLSIASHELRTPVAAVKATAQLAQRAIQRRQADPERMTRHFDMIARASDRLNALVEDLLDVSRLRTGQLQLRCEAVDMVALVDDIVRRYAGGTHDHVFHFTPAEAPLNVYGDPLRLEQVLDNLLSNAVKYSPDGGDIEVAARHEGNGVGLTVTDHGIGLPTGHEAHIFETFGRAPNAAAQQIPGLGLGLSICQQLIERHGGRISASSPGEGRGTTFAIWLPADTHG